MNYTDQYTEGDWVHGQSTINFNNLSILSHGGSQDEGGYTIKEEGYGIQLTGNSWKRIQLPASYQVTANTILKFDFSSTEQGEIQGVGFDNNNTISSSYTFQVFGTQSWGILDFDDYAGSGTTHYKISVGDYYTGSFPYLVFSMDHDSDGNSLFSNIKIYEE